MRRVGLVADDLQPGFVALDDHRLVASISA
jgi:hypothetical protein